MMNAENEFELPSIKEELERKTLAELENLLHARDSGKITNLEFQASINTLFAICSGLVDGGFFELISKASEEVVQDYSFLRTRILKKDNRLFIVSRKKNVKKRQFAVLIIDCAVTNIRAMKGDCDELDTNRKTELSLEQFWENLDKKGYIDIFNQ